MSLEQLAPIRTRTVRLAVAFVLVGALGILVPRAHVSALIINGANAAVGALAAWATLRRARAEASARRGWLLLSASLCFYTAGQLAAAVPIIWRGHVLPFPSVGDLVAFCFLPVSGISFLLFGDRQPGPARLRSGIDALIFASATFFFLWSVALSERDLSGLPRLLLPVGLAFAIGTSVNLGILVQLLGRSPGRWRGPLGYLAVGFLLAAVTGALMVILGIGRRYYSGHPVDVIAIAGGAIGVCGFVSPRPVLPAQDDEPHEVLSPADLVLYVPVLLVALTSIVRAIAYGHRPDAVESIVGIAIVVAVSLRQLLTLQDLRRLSQSLELKVLERTGQLEVSQTALLRAQRLDALGQMSGGIAHDFNNLLTVLSMSAAHLRRARGIVGEDIDAIDASLERATALTQNLLAFSRKQAIQPRVLDLDRLLDDLMPILERIAGRDYSLARKRGADTRRTIADAGQIEQVIINLVANARDALPDGGEIELGTAADGNDVVLWVRDRGVGMPPEVVARACEPFFTTKDPGRGTGFGLATSWGIVQQVGGTLEIDSEPGRGTTVRIRLPGTSEAVVDASRAEPQAQAVAPAGTRVLVVDDTPAVRRSMAGVLREQGYAVLEAGDAAEALAIADTLAALDLLVTDMSMPRMSGRELAERTKVRHPGVKILIVSGFHEELSELPAASVLHKPFSPTALLAKVQTLLAAHAGG